MWRPQTGKGKGDTKMIVPSKGFIQRRKGRKEMKD
jgi:hypothetical protein